MAISTDILCFAMLKMGSEVLSLCLIGYYIYGTLKAQKNIRDFKGIIEERKFTIQEMMDADEVIVTDTKTECCPVIQIEDKVIGDGKRGPVTALLDEKYKEMIVEQCKEVM